MAASYYRFYLQRDGQTFAAEVLECDSDSDAMARAKELLALTTTFRLMEVWQGTRKVGIVEHRPLTLDGTGLRGRRRLVVFWGTPTTAGE